MELIGVARHNCLHRGYKMERYTTVCANAVDGNCTGHKPDSNPQISQSHCSDIFAIFRNIKNYISLTHFSFCKLPRAVAWPPLVPKPSPLAPSLLHLQMGEHQN